VAHGGRRVCQLVVGEDHARPRLERRVGRKRLACAKDVNAVRAHEGRLVGGHVGREHDVARARRRRRQREVRFGPGPSRAVDLERPLLPLGEQDVVDDDLRRPARQVVEQVRVDHARPGPAADLRLEAPDAAVVDSHEHDIAARRRRVGRHPHAQVVGLQLDRPEERGVADGPCQRSRGRADRAPNQDSLRPSLHQDTCSPCARPSSGRRMAG